jgi:hypothetical protein
VKIGNFVLDEVVIITGANQKPAPHTENLVLHTVQVHQTLYG